MDSAPLNPSSSPTQAQNSPRSRQSRRSLEAARGVLPPSDSSSPPPRSLSEIVDQDQFLPSSYPASTDSFPSKEATVGMAASSYLADDASAETYVQEENTDNGGAVKRPAWNKPSNGSTTEVGAVMGAESWPALSESARSSPKSPSTYSVKASPHGSFTAPQEVAMVSFPSPKKPNTIIPTPTLTTNHGSPARQKSMKSDGSSSNHRSMPANGSLSQASPATAAVFDALPSNIGKSGGSGGESGRDAGQKGESYTGNELQRHRNSFKKNNAGQMQRGDGSYHRGNGVGHDQERGKQDWSASLQNLGGRESHITHQRVGSRPFLRGPAPNGHFIPSQPPSVAVLPPFVAPLVYTDMPSPVYYVQGLHPESIRPMQMVAMQQVYLPMQDPNFTSKIVNQIDYYFSNENLVKDTFLRQNMDNEGWVPVNLIAGFKMVKQLTDNIQAILDAVQASNVVEVQGTRLRRKGDWVKWIMPTARAINKDMVAANFSSITVDEKAAT